MRLVIQTGKCQLLVENGGFLPLSFWMCSTDVALVVFSLKYNYLDLIYGYGTSETVKKSEGKILKK